TCSEAVDGTLVKSDIIPRNIVTARLERTEFTEMTDGPVTCKPSTYFSLSNFFRSSELIDSIRTRSESIRCSERRHGTSLVAKVTLPADPTTWCLSSTTMRIPTLITGTKY